ncbi:phenylacetic acid degradation protein PaaY [Nakamurella silvestris]|nr:phenylacetic acid degradation protein PaaY [Nakamurella silvestris]
MEGAATGVFEIDGVVPVVDPTAYVHPSAVLIGDVVIGAGAYIGPGASLRGDMGRISVGAGANVQDGCVLHCFPGRETVVAPNGHVGHRAVLHGCRIGAGVLVGIGAVVMDGVVVGEGSFIGASSFVAADTQIPPGRLFLGTPARDVRALTEAELAWKANGTRVYQDLARRSLAGLRPVVALTEVPSDGRVLAVDADTAKPLREHRSSAQ